MSKFKVGDKVRVINNDAPFFRAGDIGLVTETDGRLVTIKSDTPSYSLAEWVTNSDNIERVTEEKPAGLDGGGKRFNSDKPRVELLVAEAMEAEARVWAMGAKKYGDWNWQRGMKWTTVLGCLLRHTFAIMRGEDFDEESGELHAAHIKCNATMLIYYYTHYKEGDDRFPSNQEETK